MSFQKEFHQILLEKVKKVGKGQIKLFERKMKM